LNKQIELIGFKARDKMQRVENLK